jgi:hypothetical protein
MDQIMNMFTQVFLPLIGALAGGVAAYIAIRSDIATLKAQVAILQSSNDRAHARIDSLQQRK